jgi:transcriptional regulator with XRE-family HTH domain
MKIYTEVISMELEEALAQILKKHRLNCGISQEELAHQCEIDRTYISMIERQKRKPTLHILFRICKALNITPSVFLSEIEDLIKL